MHLVNCPGYKITVGKTQGEANQEKVKASTPWHGKKYLSKILAVNRPKGVIKQQNATKNIKEDSQMGPHPFI